LTANWITQARKPITATTAKRRLISGSSAPRHSAMTRAIRNSPERELRPIRRDSTNSAVLLSATAPSMATPASSAVVLSASDVRPTGRPQKTTV